MPGQHVGQFRSRPACIAGPIAERRCGKPHHQTPAQAIGIGSLRQDGLGQPARQRWTCGEQGQQRPGGSRLQRRSTLQHAIKSLHYLDRGDGLTQRPQLQGCFADADDQPVLIGSHLAAGYVEGGSRLIDAAQLGLRISERHRR